MKKCHLSGYDPGASANPGRFRNWTVPGEGDTGVRSSSRRHGVTPRARSPCPPAAPAPPASALRRCAAPADPAARPWRRSWPRPPPRSARLRPRPRSTGPGALSELSSSTSRPLLSEGLPTRYASTCRRGTGQRGAFERHLASMEPRLASRGNDVGVSASTLATLASMEPRCAFRSIVNTWIGGW